MAYEPMLKPILPISRSPVPVSDRQYLHHVVLLPMNDSKRKTPQDKLPAAELTRRPALGRCDHQVHGPVQLSGKLKAAVSFCSSTN